MKKVLSFMLTLTMLMSLFAMPAFAATTSKQETGAEFQPQSFTVVTDGHIENFYINENREVFVNGKNITTITQKSSPKKSTPNRIEIMAKSESWEYAGQNVYHYDLTGLSAAGAAKMLSKLGLKVAASTLNKVAGSFISGGTFLPGVEIEDTRDIYYKNINKSRPDMKEVHTLYLVADGAGNSARKYLGKITTYA
ncbi:hypothetical protein [Faecalispora jeddahensis]|uniref:hypothetical protein n=1 Tax=Faecalispora jeddahensis TaxID=1414721 RepID=UPI00189A44EB|nr:hypothetical protein [Faecalispora jeddahensis]